MKFDMKKLKPVWTKEIHTQDYDAIRDITIDDDENCYVRLNGGDSIYVFDANGNNTDILDFDDSLMYMERKSTNTLYALVDSSFLVIYSISGKGKLFQLC